MNIVVGLIVVVVGVGLIVGGAETFAEHLAVALVRVGVSTFAMALLLAGAVPEELATSVTASLRDVPGIAFGDVIGANVAICLVARCWCVRRSAAIRTASAPLRDLRAPARGVGNLVLVGRPGRSR